MYTLLPTEGEIDMRLAIMAGIVAVVGMMGAINVNGNSDMPVQLTVGDTTCDLAVDESDILVSLRYLADASPVGSECDDLTGQSFRLILACQEDEVIVGYGDFHSTGYWDEYGCIPLDDMVGN